MKVLLVQPDEKNLPGLNFGGLMTLEPIALELLAASIPEHEVKIIDLRIESKPIDYFLKKFRPDIVGVTGVTAQHELMQGIINTSKSYGAYTIAGGSHATFRYCLFSNLDAVVVGEGEGSFRKLVSALYNNSSLEEVPNLQFRKNDEWVATKHMLLDDWPLPNRALVGENKYTIFGKKVLMIEATRGCPHRCNFCVAPHLFNGRYRIRPAREVVEYISSMPHPIVLFPDPDFMASSKYVWSLVKELRMSGIKKQYMVMARSDEIIAEPELIKEFAKVGLLTVFIGYEGISQDALDRFGKDNSVTNNEQVMSILDECGVISLGSIIIDPNWGLEDFKTARLYSKKLRSDVTLFSILTPFPGTDISSEYDVTEDFSKFDLIHAVTKTSLPPELFHEEFLKLSKAAINDNVIKLGTKLIKHGLLSAIPKAVFGLVKYVRNLRYVSGWY